jgi:hypothetical protein
MLMQKCFRKSKLGMPASNTCKSQEASDSVYRTQVHRHPGKMASNCQSQTTTGRVYCMHLARDQMPVRQRVAAYIMPGN